MFALAITPSVRARQREYLTAYLDQSKFAWGRKAGRQDQGHWDLAVTFPYHTYKSKDRFVTMTDSRKHNFVEG